MLLALFFAQSAPPPMSGEWQANLISFGIMVLICLSIWEKFKRKPALEETFEKKLVALSEATEKRMLAEGTAIEKRMQTQSDQTDRKIEALDRRREDGDKAVRELIHEQISAMEKFISRQITDNRENSVEKFGAIFAKLDASQVSMQGLSNDVMHHIGKLEGQLVEMGKRTTQ